MRLRKFEKVSDIKEDPDARVVFPPKNYQDYLDLKTAGGEVNLTVTALCRAVAINWIRDYTKTTVPAIREAMRLRIVQRVHGLEQTDIFSKMPRARFRKVKIPKSVGSLISKVNSKSGAKAARKGKAKK